MLRSEAKPLSSKQCSQISVVLAAVALAACVAHGYWVGGEIDKTIAEVTRVEAPGKELAALQKQKTDAETARKKTDDEITKRRIEVEQAELTLDAHRRRLGKLLESLSNDTSHEWVLRKIEGNPSELLLVGVTMHPEHVTGMAAKMAHELAPLGWSVEPPEQQARNVLDNGGPWSFSLRLRDIKLIEGPPPSPSATPSNIVRMPLR